MPKTSYQNLSPVYGYLQKPTMVDYPGYLATVMFTSGCNFQCGFCHNASLIAEKQKGISWHKLDEACNKFSAQWVNGAVISGGEPTIWGEKLIQLISFFKNFGFAVKLDTNGSHPEILAKAIKLVDMVSMDIKCGLDKYQALTGFENPAKIVSSIQTIKAAGIRYEFRTTIIENFHTDKEMQAIGRLIDGAEKYILQPFVPRENLPDKEFREKTRTPPERMEFLCGLLKDYAKTVEAKGA